MEKKVVRSGRVENGKEMRIENDLRGKKKADYLFKVVLRRPKKVISYTRDFVY